MLRPADYLRFAAEAEQSATAAPTAELSEHWAAMARAWRDLEAFTAATEACRPGGPCLE